MLEMYSNIIEIMKYVEALLLTQPRRGGARVEIIYSLLLGRGGGIHLQS